MEHIAQEVVATRFDVTSPTLLRAALHHMDVAPLRLGRRPMPWQALLRAAPEASLLLHTHMERQPAVNEFVFTQRDPDFKFLASPIEGYYQPATKRIAIRTCTLRDTPQDNVITVWHEMAHAVLHGERALLGYYTDPRQFLQMEIEAELVSIIVGWELGYQLPPLVFEGIKRVVVPETRHIYAAIIDFELEPVLLPVAQEIVRAFREAR
jgi:hypothetical protein